MTTKNSITSFRCAHHVTGFTLVELLISIAIIVIITSMVLVRYDKFDSTVLLKNTAYDVALTIREVQVRALSAVRGSTNEAKYPYGVTFTPAGGSETGKEYTTFRFEDAVAYPYYAISGNEYPIIDPTPPPVNDVLTSTIDRTMYVSNVCVDTDSTSGCDESVARLDISFRRPEFQTLFFAEKVGGGFVATSTIRSATIVLESPRGADKFEVSVSQLGQITIKKQ